MWFSGGQTRISLRYRTDGFFYQLYGSQRKFRSDLTDFEYKVHIVIKKYALEFHYYIGQSNQYFLKKVTISTEVQTISMRFKQYMHLVVHKCFIKLSDLSCWSHLSILLWLYGTITILYIHIHIHLYKYIIDIHIYIYTNICTYK